MDDKNWYELENTDQVISPALLFYPDRIRKNIEHMIEISGDPGRMWTHVKTHKNEEIIRMQLEAGINKFKCSTLSEAELIGRCGAKEAVLAMQPTKVHLESLLSLISHYPETGFSTLVDNKETLDMISEKARASGMTIRLWLDINNGMTRTGIPPGKEAIDLYESMSTDPGIECMGIHVYDGHIHDSDLDSRRKNSLMAMNPVLEMRDAIIERNLSIKTIIAGGSPTFSTHADNQALDLSPRTTLLWDAGYRKNYPDLPFRPAATLLSRVVSKPASGIICTDLGHKSVASEMSFPRVEFLDQKAYKQVSQSEEHLVLECEKSEEVSVGQELYALPLHICPTVSKYSQIHVVLNKEITANWNISAQNHELELTNKET